MACGCTVSHQPTATGMAGACFTETKVLKARSSLQRRGLQSPRSGPEQLCDMRLWKSHWGQPLGS